MSEVFGDAFYYIALLNPSDTFHAAAVDATKTLNQKVVTTVWVLMEVGDALSASSVRQRTHQFLLDVSADSNTLILADTKPWFGRGLQLYGQRTDKEWSLTDCISFEVMNARNITEALTGDRHFVQAGFRALLAPLPSHP
jgi:predicted nucleic acid-binding protein